MISECDLSGSVHLTVPWVSRIVSIAQPKINETIFALKGWAYVMMMEGEIG